VWQNACDWVMSQTFGLEEDDYILNLNLSTCCGVYIRTFPILFQWYGKNLYFSKFKLNQLERDVRPINTKKCYVKIYVLFLYIVF